MVQKRRVTPTAKALDKSLRNSAYPVLLSREKYLKKYFKLSYFHIDRFFLHDFSGSQNTIQILLIELHLESVASE
jgi:hypothetical protein